VLAAILVVATVLSIPSNFSIVLGTPDDLRQQMFAFDSLDKQHEIPLKVIYDISNNTAKNIANFQIGSENVVQLHQEEDLAVVGYPSNNDLIKVTLSDKNGDNTMEIKPKSPQSESYYSLQGFPAGTYILDVVLGLQGNLEGVYETILIVLDVTETPNAFPKDIRDDLNIVNNNINRKEVTFKIINKILRTPPDDLTSMPGPTPRPGLIPTKPPEPPSGPIPPVVPVPPVSDPVQSPVPGQLPAAPPGTVAIPAVPPGSTILPPGSVAIPDGNDVTIRMPGLPDVRMPGLDITIPGPIGSPIPIRAPPQIGQLPNGSLVIMPPSLPSLPSDIIMPTTAAPLPQPQSQPTQSLAEPEQCMCPTPPPPTVKPETICPPGFQLQKAKSLYEPDACVAYDVPVVQKLQKPPDPGDRDDDKDDDGDDEDKEDQSEIKNDVEDDDVSVDEFLDEHFPEDEGDGDGGNGDGGNGDGDLSAA